MYFEPNHFPRFTSQARVNLFAWACLRMSGADRARVAADMVKHLPRSFRARTSLGSGLLG